MIKESIGAQDTWTPWAYFENPFAFGINTASFSSTITLQYSPKDRPGPPPVSGTDVIVPLGTYTAQTVKIVEPPEKGGWYRAGIATGDYTDAVEVFLAG